MNKVEVIFWLEIKAPTTNEAQVIGADIRIKHPQTAETIAPEHVGAWEMKVDDDRD